MKTNYLEEKFEDTHRTQHRSKTISFSMLILNFFTLFRIAKTCNVPVIGAARNLAQYEFEVDNSCHPTASPLHFHDTSSAAMRLRGGTLSRESYSLTEFSRASAVSFAPSATVSGRCNPTSPDAAFHPPLHARILNPMVRHYRDAAARMQHGRPPKLSRSVEVNESTN